MSEVPRQLVVAAAALVNLGVTADAAARIRFGIATGNRHLERSDGTVGG